jgi:hypothetical protein
MHHLMMNLPMIGTLGMAALLAGPLARLPIDLGAWLLERCLGGRAKSYYAGKHVGQAFQPDPAGASGWKA